MENRGQADRRVRYSAQGAGYAFAFTSEQVVLSLAVPPDRLAEVVDAAKRTSTSITEIGAFTTGSAVRFADRDGRDLVIKKQGFTHF